MKYPRKIWKESRGYGKSATIGCTATAQADKLNELLWKLTCSYDLADKETDISIFQMEEAKGELAAILRDLNRLVQESERLLKKQAKKYTEKAEAEWQEQIKSS